MLWAAQKGMNIRATKNTPEVTKAILGLLDQIEGVSGSICCCCANLTVCVDSLRRKSLCHLRKRIICSIVASSKFQVRERHFWIRLPYLFRRAFLHADNADREGKRDKGTAGAFRTAAM
jgi:hypothetical protein